jgi:hypothetical protein
MTIQQILTSNPALTLEELEAEIRARDTTVQQTRAEMLQIKRLLDPLEVAKQREAITAARLAGKPVINIGMDNLKMGQAHGK